MGGGTAGLAVASRLSQERPDFSILVVEAGPAAPDDPKINIPGNKVECICTFGVVQSIDGFQGATLGGPYDWNFTTIPQSALNNRKITQNRGRVLGGTSALNLMVWDRGGSSEYDTWQSLGNHGWNWSTLYQAMLKVENFTHTGGTYGEQGVAEGGVIQTLINTCLPGQIHYFIPTGENLGLKNNLESLDGYPLGVQWQPNNFRRSDYKRSYSAFNPGYPSIAGPGLQIVLNTTVAKIDLDGDKDNVSASGVTLVDGTVIKASKEVILSAGVFLSPALLERSGIGNSTILDDAGISTIIELPGVGENLQDHFRIQTSYQLRQNYTSLDALRYNVTYAAEQLALYNAGQCSRYDYSSAAYIFATWNQITDNQTTANLNSLAQHAVANPLTDQPIESIRSRILLDRLQNSTTDVPQIETIFSDTYNGVKGYPAANSTLYGEDFFALISAIQHPFSLGSVHINTSSPTSAPVINPKYLSQEYDVQALITAVKYNRKLASTQPLSQAWITEYEPGFDVIPAGPDSYDTDTYDNLWRQYVLNNMLTIYHPVGSCPMLPQDIGGVVNPELLVYGTSNLRVVDASVIPLIISAHPQTVVYAIAERAAQFIAERWKA